MVTVVPGGRSSEVPGADAKNSKLTSAGALVVEVSGTREIVSPTWIVAGRLIATVAFWIDTVCRPASTAPLPPLTHGPIARKCRLVVACTTGAVKVARLLPSAWLKETLSVSAALCTHKIDVLGSA